MEQAVWRDSQCLLKACAAFPTQKVKQLWLGLWGFAVTEAPTLVSRSA